MQGGWTSYPLSLLDFNYRRDLTTLGWVVEGRADEVKLEKAIEAVTKRWRLLAARIVEHEKGLKVTHSLRIPVADDLPDDFVFYGFTTMDASQPLSAYIQLPMDISSNVLPAGLMHPVEPRQVRDFFNKDVPLLHWHVTRFTSDSSVKSEMYSFISVTYPHTVFDGFGISSILRVVEAELSGVAWDIPFPVPEGGPEVENILVEEVEREIARKKADRTWEQIPAYTSYYITTFSATLLLMAWYWWQGVWHKSHHAVVRIPPAGLKKLHEIHRDQNGTVRLSRSDIIVAFIIKAVYSKESENISLPIGIANLASARRFFEGKLAKYPFNSVIQLPFPKVTVKELHKLSITDIASLVSRYRQTFTQDTILKAYDMCQEAQTFSPTSKVLIRVPGECYPFIFSNMIPYNIANVDWTGCGVGKTLVRHKDWRNGIAIDVTDAIMIVGYMEDGGLLLDVHLTERKRAALEEGIRNLVKE